MTNLLIIPVQPLVMLSGSLGVLLGVVGAIWLAQATFWFTWLGLVWTVTIVQLTAGLPGASLSIAGYGFGALALTYLIVFILRWRATLLAGVARFVTIDSSAWQQRLIGPGAAVGMGACALLVWSALGSLPDGRLHIHFLDIGQGDGILIQTPSGRQLLIDGGGSPERLFNELGTIMPFWDRDLDLVAVTNPDQDHMAAQVQLVNRFQVGAALDTLASRWNPASEPWRTALTAGGAELQLQHRGGWVDLGDGVGLWVLWPPEEIFGQEKLNDEQFIDNENSLVLKLTYGEFSVLLTGDAGIPAEFAMLAADAPLQSTVLKVGHHGSSGSSSAPFVRAVNPQVAVIQSAADNKYGHPHKEVLQNLAGRTVFRNDLHGRIHISSDGQQMWVETAKNHP